MLFRGMLGVLCRIERSHTPRFVSMTFVAFLALLLGVGYGLENDSHVRIYNNGSRVVFTSENEHEVEMEVRGALDVTSHINSPTIAALRREFEIQLETQRNENHRVLEAQRNESHRLLEAQRNEFEDRLAVLERRHTMEGDVDVNEGTWQTLAGVTRITGSLRIANQEWVTELGVLRYLASVGGDCFLYTNAVLTTLDSLSSLTSVGGFLNINTNAVLTNLDGLSSLTSVGEYLYIHNNRALTNLDGLRSLTSVGRYLNIITNTALTNLDGLSSLTSVGGDLYIHNNRALTNLDGLSSLTSVGNSLTINNNAVLTDISGLSSLTEVLGDYIRVCGNPQLSAIPEFYSTLSQGKSHCHNILRTGPSSCVC